MAKSRTTQRDDDHQLSRRALIRWTLAAGAALGVARSKVFEILEGAAGPGVAYAAADNPTTRLFSMVGGNGGAAWWQLMWPHADIARAHDPAFAWHRPGEERDVPGTRNPLTIGPDTPWADLPAASQVTCFVCGANEAHVDNPTSNATLDGNGILAIATALQAVTAATVPVVTVGRARLGTAPGAAPDAHVPDADGFIALFDSAASQATGILARMDDAELYEAQYDAFTQLNRAANRPTTKAAYATAGDAAVYLGMRLADRLRITDADLARYRITDGSHPGVVALARVMIVAVKAYAMGLTKAVVVPFMLDDPHDAFDRGLVDVVPAQLRDAFDAFMADLAATADVATGKPLAGDVVITMHGDTVKDCRRRTGWPDSAPGNANHVYVYSAGALYPGWFGSIDRTGRVLGFGSDGKPAPYDAAATARYALASIAYAVVKQDERALARFANGITIGGVFGPPRTA